MRRLFDLPSATWKGLAKENWADFPMSKVSSNESNNYFFGDVGLEEHS